MGGDYQEAEAKACSQGALGPPTSITLIGGWPLRFKVKFVMRAEDDQEGTGHEMTVLDKVC
jgi:hypothetical protein